MLFFPEMGENSDHNIDPLNSQRQDHAAVFALRGRRSTMEDRFVMIKIQPEMGSGLPVVIHAVLDGHGGEVGSVVPGRYSGNSVPKLVY
jgi:hypothetical protein